MVHQVLQEKSWDVAADALYHTCNVIHCNINNLHSNAIKVHGTEVSPLLMMEVVTENPISDMSAKHFITSWLIHLLHKLWVPADLEFSGSSPEVKIKYHQKVESTQVRLLLNSNFIMQYKWLVILSFQSEHMNNFTSYQIYTFWACAQRSMKPLYSFSLRVIWYMPVG